MLHDFFGSRLDVRGRERHAKGDAVGRNHRTLAPHHRISALGLIRDIRALLAGACAECG